MSAPHPEDIHDVLQWLNLKSVSLAEGVPIALIRQKWQASQRDVGQLKAVLETLLADDLLSVTPHLALPHVRLSAKGYAAVTLRADQERLARTAHTPAQTAVPPAAAVPPTISPALTEHTTAASGHAAGSWPVRFMAPGRTPTEIGLRNQVLHLFRDLHLQAGQQINALTLTRYWQELALRSSDLRFALDVLVRDHYLETRIKRYERHWLLTAEGYRFMTGPVTPPGLLALAEPLHKVSDSYADDDLRKNAGALLAEAGAQVPFEGLLARWRYGRSPLLHALDLLYKDSDIEVGTDSQCLLSLTPQGLGKHRPMMTGQ